jgi:ER-bound oxygenase mpaB/B'/Rubber oxygenase, catalytic domain
VRFDLMRDGEVAPETDEEDHMTPATIEAPSRDHPRPADAPEDLVAASELGRVVDLDAIKDRFDPAVVQAVVDHMALGDELGYAAWKALRPLKAQGRAMFNQALEQGIETVENPPEELVALFEQLDTVPDYVDWEQLRRGAVALWRAGSLVPICLGYSSVGFGYSSYGGTKALNFTRLLIDENRAGQRMNETLRWYAAATTPDGLKRDGIGFKYSVRVRWVHAAARFGVSQSPKWQWNDWGLPITNTDLFFTSSMVFCANAIDALQALGISYSEQEKADIFAMFRYIGYLMGVPAELNHRSEADSRYKNQIVTAVEHEPDTANHILLHSLIGYTTKATDGYQALPAWLLDRLTPEQKLVMSYALLRHLTGDEFCKSMKVPDTPFKHAVRYGVKLNAVKERIARRLPHDDEKKARAVLRDVMTALAVDDGHAIADGDEVQSAIRKNEADLERTMSQSAG